MRFGGRIFSFASSAIPADFYLLARSENLLPSRTLGTGLGIRYAPSFLFGCLFSLASSAIPADFYFLARSENLLPSRSLGTGLGIRYAPSFLFGCLFLPRSLGTGNLILAD